MVRNVTAVPGDTARFAVTYYSGIAGEASVVLMVELLAPYESGGPRRIGVISYGDMRRRGTSGQHLPSLLLGAALVDASRVSEEWLEHGWTPGCTEIDPGVLSKASARAARNEPAKPKPRPQLSLARAFAMGLLAMSIVIFIAAWASGYIVGGDNAFGGK